MSIWHTQILIRNRNEIRKPNESSDDVQNTRIDAVWWWCRGCIVHGTLHFPDATERSDTSQFPNEWIRPILSFWIWTVFFSQLLLRHRYHCVIVSRLCFVIIAWALVLYYIHSKECVCVHANLTLEPRACDAFDKFALSSLCWHIYAKFIASTGQTGCGASGMKQAHRPRCLVSDGDPPIHYTQTVLLGRPANRIKIDSNCVQFANRILFVETTQSKRKINK